MAPFGVISYNLSDHALTYGVHGDVAYHFIHNFSAVLGANVLGLSQTAITTGGSMAQLSPVSYTHLGASPAPRATGRARRA